MSFGLMGGTFDPIHLGHLRAAESARESLGLAQVLFVPAAAPPHRGEPVASTLDRFAMVALAIADNPAFVASDVEIRRGGRSYTIDTLEALRTQRPGQTPVLIVGSDTLRELDDWRDAGRIAELARVAVVTRPGAAAPEPGGRFAGVLERVEGPALELSATAVRARLAAGGSVRYLVPPAVADYIARRGLYS